jgi:uncharacterized protein YbjT (DUF2867 family)
MNILVTGGSGVIGAGLIPELLDRSHTVRLLSRHADEDAKQWNGVEAVNGDVSDPASLHGAATGCEAVIHIAGIVTEDPPERTFAAVNVGGTGHVLDEAARAGARRFVYVSSLGAERGSSDYHHSKFEAETLVERSTLDWTIVRPGSVFGPGDEVVSVLLKMVRALPVVPTIGSGSQPFQPIWYEDLAKAIATAVEQADLTGRTLELAGDEVTSMSDVIDRFRKITDRHILMVPVPAALASAAVSAATAASIEMPVDDSKLTMLREHNVLDTAQPHALRDVLGITPTPLDDALRALADAVPEQLVEDGVGALEHKRFWADIKGAQTSPARLMTHFKEHITDVMPIEFEAEPGVPSRVELGSTLTGSLPLRGNIQVRVIASEPNRVTLATIEGHPLAGIVEFTTREHGGGVQFAIDVYARAANVFDFVALRTVGQPMQDANWRAVVQRMVEASGGTSEGVQHESAKLDDTEAEKVEKRVRDLVNALHREGSDRAETRA